MYEQHLEVLSCHYGPIFWVKMANVSKYWRDGWTTQLARLKARIGSDLIGKLGLAARPILDCDGAFLTGGHILGHILGEDYGSDVDILVTRGQGYPLEVWNNWDPLADNLSNTLLAHGYRRTKSIHRKELFELVQLSYLVKYAEIPLDNPVDHIDLIRTNAPNIIDCILKFDFTFCMNYYSNGKLYIHDIDAILTRSSAVKSNALEYNANPEKRRKKYTDRGFFIE
jgi:hypothetical protein